MKHDCKNQWSICCNSPITEQIDGTPIGNGDIGALITAPQLCLNMTIAKNNLWNTWCLSNDKIESFFPADDFQTIKQFVINGKYDQIYENFKKASLKNSRKYMLEAAANIKMRFHEPEIELKYWHQGLDMFNGQCMIDYQTQHRKMVCNVFASTKYQVIAGRIDFKSRTYKYENLMEIAIPENKEEKTRTKLSWHKTEQMLLATVTGSSGANYCVGICIAPERKARIDFRENKITFQAQKCGIQDFYIAVSYSQNTQKSTKETTKILRTALSAGFNSIEKDHNTSWKKFWSVSQITIPETAVKRMYNLGLYLLASCSKSGHRAPGLQGLWCANIEGSGWNDYTNDFNSQAFFWPAFTANHLELVDSYYQTFKSMLTKIKEDTARYYKMRGAFYPLCCSPDGHAANGYVTHYHSAGISAFIAQNYWLGYEFSQDIDFLRKTAYPVMKECALFYLDRFDISGSMAKLKASTSPEEGEGSYEAWGTNTTMDIAFIKELLKAVITSGKLLNCDVEFRIESEKLLKLIGPYPLHKGVMMEMEEKKFKDSHRHLSVLTPIFPCNDLNKLSTKTDYEIAVDSLNDYIGRGSGAWAGYSYCWLACCAARLGMGQKAIEYLKSFIGAFCLQHGGLHLNNDYTGSGKGMSGPKNFTMEGNTMYSAAVLEMLLGSYNGIIQVFPAIPPDWKDVHFENLLAQGGFLVSAEKHSGTIQKICINSKAGRQCRIQNPFGRNVKVIMVKEKTQEHVEYKSNGTQIIFETQINHYYEVSK